MSRCLYIGRFQPFHKGHMDVIQQIFFHGCDHIIIGVGSSNKQNVDNPRTFSERARMIRAAWHDGGRDYTKKDIVPLPDFTDDAEWLAYIVATVVFDVVMSGNPWVIDIFSQAGYSVLHEQERIPIHGTHIRSMLHDADPMVQQWLSPGVWDIIV